LLKLHEATLNFISKKTLATKEELQAVVDSANDLGFTSDNKRQCRYKEKT
jgi:hypothetical protein